LTQAQLAAHLKCHVNHVAELESGRRITDTVEFIEIARTLGVDPVELFAKAMARRKVSTRRPKRR
jgi:ribosome-binding protein aMBF1 (putative translation factor)